MARLCAVGFLDKETFVVKSRGFEIVPSRKLFLSSIGMLSLAACAGGGAPNIIPAAGKSRPSACLLSLSTCGGGGGPTPGNLAELSLAQVAALTTTQIAALTNTQIPTFTDAQLGYVTSASAFHGAQAAAVLQRVAASQQKEAPFYMPPGVPGPYIPTGYFPPVQGSDFWSNVGSAIVGAIAGAVGGYVGGTVIGMFAGAGGGYIGTFLGAGSDAYFVFYDSNIGGYQSIDLGSFQSIQNLTQFDSDGVSITGSFDASTSTVTITVVPN